MVRASWRIEQVSAVSVETPNTWAEAGDDAEPEQDPDEAEVVRAIEDGRIGPTMLVAHRP
jgi:hypothetical protein